MEAKVGIALGCSVVKGVGDCDGRLVVPGVGAKDGKVICGDSVCQEVGALEGAGVCKPWRGVGVVGDGMDCRVGAGLSTTSGRVDEGVPAAGCVVSARGVATAVVGAGVKALWLGAAVGREPAAGGIGPMVGTALGQSGKRGSFVQSPVVLSQSKPSAHEPGTQISVAQSSPK